MIGLVPLAMVCGLLPIAPNLADELGRLEGHAVTVADDAGSYVIDDIAGEGKPIVGVVERRGADLWLVSSDAQRRLDGPLARPRIAGPGYKIWVLGTDTGEALTAKRLGVLSPAWSR